MAYRSIAMLQRHVANDIVQDRTAYFEQLAFEANDAAEKNDMASVFNISKRLKGFIVRPPQVDQGQERRDSIR